MRKALMIMLVFVFTFVAILFFGLSQAVANTPDDKFSPILAAQQGFFNSKVNDQITARTPICGTSEVTIVGVYNFKRDNSTTDTGDNTIIKMTKINDNYYVPSIVQIRGQPELLETSEEITYTNTPVWIHSFAAIRGQPIRRMLTTVVCYDNWDNRHSNISYFAIANCPWSTQEAFHRRGIRTPMLA